MKNWWKRMNFDLTRVRDYLLWSPGAVCFGLGISRAFDYSALLGVILVVTAAFMLAGMVLTWMEEGQ